MVKVTRIQAGQYQVSDGRFIIKDGSQWYVLTSDNKHDFGPIPTLAGAKDYVTTGTITASQHSPTTKHGRRQSKKEYNAYMAAEAKNGNYWPVFISFSLMILILIFFAAVRGY